MQYRSIDIDLDVHRFLESRRTSFAQMPNDILRGVAGLSPHTVTPGNGSAKRAGENGQAGAWTWKGVTLPAGTKLRMTYNGRTQTGDIAGGAWHVGGAIYTSPSAAARSVAGGHQVNGWIYWYAKMPGSDDWVALATLRPPEPDAE